MTTLQLCNDEPTVCAESQNIEAVSLSHTRDRLPAAVLSCDCKDVFTQDIGVGDDPFLEVLALTQSSLVKTHGYRPGRRGIPNLEDNLARQDRARVSLAKQHPSNERTPQIP